MLLVISNADRYSVVGPEHRQFTPDGVCIKTVGLTKTRRSVPPIRKEGYVY